MKKDIKYRGEFIKKVAENIGGVDYKHYVYCTNSYYTTLAEAKAYIDEELEYQDRARQYIDMETLVN